MVRVTTASASQNVRVGVYLYETAKNVFTLLPATEAVVAADSTGRKDIALGKDIVFTPEARYYVGFVASDATLAVGSITSGGNLLGHLRVGGVTGSLPRHIELNSTTLTATGAIPGVCYVSSKLGL
jgi:hypothetical protein